MGGTGMRMWGAALAFALFGTIAVQAGAQESDPSGLDLVQLERDCDAGEFKACKHLGDAYRDGEGVPRVAAVAKILYVQACDALLAEACFELGELHRYQRFQSFSPEPAGDHYAKACKLELDKACLSLASLLNQNRDWDEPEALGLVERSCQTGNLSVCNELARYRVASQADAAKVAWGYSMLDAQCLAQVQEACSTAVSYASHTSGLQNNRYPVWLETLCDMGVSHRCEDRARFAVRDQRTVEEVSEAQFYLDKACALDMLNCWPADALRDLPRVEALCRYGDEKACGQWGRYLQADNFLMPDRAAARTLLGQACLAGLGQFCADAIYLENEFTDPNLPEDNASIVALRQASCDAGAYLPCRELALQYLNNRELEQPAPEGVGIVMTFCEAGEIEACTELAEWYRDGTYVAKDLPKAAGLFDQVCGADDWRREQACDERNKLAVLVPGLPVPTAGEQYEPIEPPLTAEELAALEAEDNCILNEVVFRNELFREMDCSNVVPRGRLSNPINASRAPWQALLWRPRGGQGLSGLQRVACGGTLIKDGWILTAAHCLSKTDIVEEGYTVRLSVSNPAAPQGFEFPVKQAIPHPGFKRHGYAFDIGLIRYDPQGAKVHSWPYSPAAAALDKKAIDERTITEDMKVYAYGWGWTDVENSQPTEHLQSIPMKLATLADCEELTKYRDRARKNAVLCAAGDDGAQACFGDSGGGLFYYGDGTGPVLIGVVSAGKACGTTGLDSRYPRIAKVRMWIEREIAKYERANGRSGR